MGGGGASFNFCSAPASPSGPGKLLPHDSSPMCRPTNSGLAKTSKNSIPGSKQQTSCPAKRLGVADVMGVPRSGCDKSRIKVAIVEPGVIPLGLHSAWTKAKTPTVPCDRTR